MFDITKASPEQLEEFILCLRDVHDIMEEFNNRYEQERINSTFIGGNNYGKEI